MLYFFIIEFPLIVLHIFKMLNVNCLLIFIIAAAV